MNEVSITERGLEASIDGLVFPIHPRRPLRERYFRDNGLELFEHKWHLPTITSDAFRGLNGQDFNIGWWVYGETTNCHAVGWFQIVPRHDQWFELTGPWQVVHVMAGARADCIYLGSMTKYEEVLPSDASPYRPWAEWEKKYSGALSGDFQAAVQRIMHGFDMASGTGKTAVEEDPNLKVTRIQNHYTLQVEPAMPTVEPYHNTGVYIPDMLDTTDSPSAVIVDTSNYWHCDCGHDNDPNVSPLKCGICRRFR